MTSIVSILDEMLDDASAKPAPNHKTPEAAVATVENHRERLIAIIAGGKAKVYLRKELSVDKIDAMSNEEIGKLCSI